MEYGIAEGYDGIMEYARKVIRSLRTTDLKVSR